MTDNATPPVDPADEVYAIYGNVIHVVHWWEPLTALGSNR